LLGHHPADADAAPLDAVAADLAVDLPGRDRKREAEKLARRAIAAAERVPLPAIACQAWVLIGTIARDRDLAESSACFERSRLLAEEHRLPIWRVYGVYEQARNDWLSDGDPAGLDQVRHEARRVGAITQTYVVDASMAIHAVMCGNYDEAAVLIRECGTVARRLRLDYITMYLQMVASVMAAHRGQRRGMDDALSEFRAVGGEQAPEQALALGMAAAFCALLEEDRARAREELTRLQRSEEDAPTIFSLAGRHGLRVLVDVLDGVVDRAGFESVSASVMSQMRWNRQFVLLAKAVLAGRAGRVAEAGRAVADSRAASAIYPMTRHLGLRLVAQAAIQDGWGDPETWLREAEEYFHQADVPAVASACRALLRQTGASVRQRRTGTDRVPAALRALGVTVREFEVFQLLVDRIGNKAIAGRLHISPRTVEKHIASLVVKTGQPDREALHTYAATTLTE
jgi:DNA-binding CsgD family transcriptional regulator